MRWLLLMGLALDGVGAILIAWPLITTPPEAREHSVMRWGGSPWIVVMRIREARFVQIGALFLASGFVLQASGYVIGLDSKKVAASALIVATIVVGLVLGVAVAHRGRPRYATFEDEPTFEDQRHVYNIARAEDYRRLLTPYVHERHGRPPILLSERAAARINQGSWHASCPECGPSTVVSAWPGNPEAICSDGGHVFAVDFPPESDRLRIEKALALRSRKRRHWTVGDSVEKLESDNRAEGLA